ncbi:MAG: hypothetical protein JW888_00995, partial [Pirellulales bacterium]|nr:hypothetical protein [Pirellulales bacterium]
HNDGRAFFIARSVLNHNRPTAVFSESAEPMKCLEKHGHARFPKNMLTDFEHHYTRYGPIGS